MLSIQHLIERTASCETLIDLSEQLTLELEDAADSDTVYQQLQELAHYFNQRGYVEFALWLWQELLAIRVEDHILYEITKVYHQQGDVLTASDYLQQLLAHNTQTSTLYLAAMIYVHQQDYAQAKNFLKAIMKQEPTYVEAYELMAILYERLEDYEKAKYYDRILLEYFPKYTKWRDVRLHYFDLLLQADIVNSQDFTYFTQPPYPVMTEVEEFYRLGLLQALSGLQEQAVQSLEKAIALNTDAFEYRFVLLEVLAALNQSDALTQQILSLTEIIPFTDSAIYFLGEWANDFGAFNVLLWQKLKDYSEIIDDEEESFQIIQWLLKPSNHDMTDDARLQLLDEFSSTFPDPDYLVGLYAPIYARLNRVEEAIVAYQIGCEQLSEQLDYVEEACAYFLMNQRFDLEAKYRSTNILYEEDDRNGADVDD